jgi:hypothetical protein
MLIANAKREGGDTRAIYDFGVSPRKLIKCLGCLVLFLLSISFLLPLKGPL